MHEIRAGTAAVGGEAHGLSYTIIFNSIRTSYSISTFDLSIF